MDGISIIIATLNRHDYLVETTRMLLMQAFDKKLEIIIVDQSDQKDVAYEKAYGEYAKVRYFHVTSFRGLPQARNFGCLKSRYDCLLFLDDDISISDDRLLEAHYECLRKADVGIVAGGVTQVNGPNYDVRHPGSFNRFLVRAYGGFHQRPGGYVSFAVGANFSVKKRLFLLSGGSDEHFNVGSALGEETDLCMRIGRMGYRVFFNPDAHVQHLKAPEGGCREEDLDTYCYAMIHNRTIMTHRFCRFYHLPTAYLYSAYATLIFSKRNRKSFFGAMLRGMRDGIRDYHEGVKNQFSHGPGKNQEQTSLTE